MSRAVCCIKFNSWHPSESWGAPTGLLGHLYASKNLQSGWELGRAKKQPCYLSILHPLLKPPYPIYPLIHCLWHPREMSLHKERGSITRNFSFTHLLLCTAMTFYLLSYLGLQPSETGKRSQQCQETLQDLTSASHVQAPPALQTAHRAHPTLQSNSNHRTQGPLL